VEVTGDRIQIQGHLGWAKQKQMTPINLMILRVVMLTVGRFFPNLIRSLLQKLLIVGKTAAPFRFTRELRWADGHWYVTDTLKADDWSPVEAVGIGAAQTSIYVVMSRTYQAGQLQPWLDLSDRLPSLSPGQILEVERRL
jgi:hypothetical protein